VTTPETTIPEEKHQTVYIIPETFTPDEVNTFVDKLPAEPVNVLIGPLVYAINQLPADIPKITQKTLDDEIFQHVTSKLIVENLAEIEPDFTKLNIIPIVTNDSNLFLPDYFLNKEVPTFPIYVGENTTAPKFEPITKAETPADIDFPNVIKHSRVDSNLQMKKTQIFYFCYIRENPITAKYRLQNKFQL
jgi:hypothetical protein